MWWLRVQARPQPLRLRAQTALPLDAVIWHSAQLLRVGVMRGFGECYYRARRLSCNRLTRSSYKKLRCDRTRLPYCFLLRRRILDACDDHPGCTELRGISRRTFRLGRTSAAKDPPTRTYLVPTRLAPSHGWVASPGRVTTFAISTLTVHQED